MIRAALSGALLPALAEEAIALRDDLANANIAGSNQKPFTGVVDNEIAIPLQHNANLQSLAREKDEYDDGDAYDTVYNISSDVINATDVAMINNATLDIVLKIAQQAGTDKMMYGCIISLGYGNFINPLHPLVANEIVNGNLELPETFTLSVFSFRPSYQRDFANISESAYAPYIKVYVDLFNKLRDARIIQQDTKLNIQTTEATLTKQVFEGRNLESIKVLWSTELPEADEFIVPIQLATRAAVIPYYGAIYSKRPQGASASVFKSVNLFPMNSGNVSLDYDIGRVEFSSTCTGDRSGNTTYGLMSLGNMNLNSLYSEGTLGYRWKESVIASQLVAGTLLESFLTPKGDQDGQEEN